jgi:hypothetical protein
VRDRLAYGMLLGAGVLGIAGCTAAALTQVWPPLFAGTVAAFVLASLWFLNRLSAGQPAPFQWAAGGAAMFLLLAVAVHQILPGYHRRFALRGVVRDQLALARDERTPVYCYPRRWDSVSFYLDRPDVRVFSAEQRAELLRELQAHPRVLLFVKSPHLADLTSALPPTLEFVPHGRQSPHVAAGIVQPRTAGAKR